MYHLQKIIFEIYYINRKDKGAFGKTHKLIEPSSINKPKSDTKPFEGKCLKKHKIIQVNI